MCDLKGHRKAIILEDKSHLELKAYNNGYGVFCDNKNDLWYFASIDANFYPLILYDGSFKQISKIFRLWVEYRKIFWDILESDKNH